MLSARAANVRGTGRSTRGGCTITGQLHFELSHTDDADSKSVAAGDHVTTRFTNQAHATAREQLVEQGVHGGSDLGEGDAGAIISHSGPRARETTTNVQEVHCESELLTHLEDAVSAAEGGLVGIQARAAGTDVETIQRIFSICDCDEKSN